MKSKEKRILIIGNSGTGKSVLAATLSELWGIPYYNIDKLVELPGSHKSRHPSANSKQEFREILSLPEWIIEGVHSGVASQCLARATQVLWLDLDQEACISNLLSKGQKPGESFEEFLEWAGAYWRRRDNFSWAAHSNIFNSYKGSKNRLLSQHAVRNYLSDLVGASLGS